MSKVRWSEDAENDLENIVLYYLEQAGVRVAKSVYARIGMQVESLEQFPERARPGRVSGTREYIISKLPYIAVVDVVEDTVIVLNIVHMAKKYPAGI